MPKVAVISATGTSIASQASDTRDLRSGPHPAPVHRRGLPGGYGLAAPCVVVRSYSRAATISARCASEFVRCSVPNGGKEMYSRKNAGTADQS